MASLATPPLRKDDKNYYHPSTEQEIIDMVKYANQNKLELRVRGSGHSFPRSIFTDKCTLDKVDVDASAPKGNNINLMLDKYAKIESLTKESSFVRVQAGICLGYNPNYSGSTSNNGLLDQLYNHGWTFDDLGGVTRQTVSGFLSTGSSGGSTTYSIEKNVYALRIIDGTGQVYEVNRDEDHDMFRAALVSMGLLGVLSKVTFKCSPTFDIQGEQNSSSVENCKVDIFNDNPSDITKTGLTTFLTSTTYARILWWPQASNISADSKTKVKTNERLQVWQAHRIKLGPNDEIKSFKLFHSLEEMMLYSFLMTFMGNIEHMEEVRTIMDTKKSRFDSLLHEELSECHCLTKPAIEMITCLLNLINDLIFNLLTGIGDHIPREIRRDILPVISTVAMNILTRLN